MSKPKQTMPKPKQAQVGMWQAGRDVLVASIRKGQFPLAIILFVVMLFLWKTPGDYYPKIWDHVFSAGGKLTVVSGALNLALVFGWAAHARAQRRIFKEETDRIVMERNKLQEHKIGGVASSKD